MAQTVFRQSDAATRAAGFAPMLMTDAADIASMRRRAPPALQGTLMESSETIPDLAAMLQPFDGDAPTGRDLRLDVTPMSVYFRLRDARSGARAQERAADNDPAATDTGFQQWMAVRDLAVSALTGDTKDIEIAAWLTESLVRSNGLPGLSAGARLMRGLLDAFWDQGLFPALDDGGVEDRLAPIAGLNGEGGNGTLLQPLRKLVLFERNDGAPLSFWQFEQSEDVDRLTDAARKAQRIAGGVKPFAELETEARSVGRAALAIVAQQCVQAIADWTALETALDRVGGRDAPSVRRVSELLNQLRRVAERYAGVVVVQPADAAPEPTPDGAEAEPATASVAPPSPAVPDRETLLAEIVRIAALFRAAEPSSPLSYTLEEAVRRARLGLPELLKEMMPELAPRAALLASLGIRPGPD
jgi:type VI secretion system protein ImpA